jgi:hypothetical protein
MNVMMTYYRTFLYVQGIFLLSWRVHGSALHGDRCTVGGEAHADFADESADNVLNEGK